MRSNFCVCIFFPLLPMLLVSYPRNHYHIQYCDSFVLFFSKNFLVLSFMLRFLIHLKILYMVLSGTGLKNPSANAGDARDAGSVSGSGRYPGVGNSNLLQYSCLKNSMEKAA